MKADTVIDKNSALSSKNTQRNNLGTKSNHPSHQIMEINSQSRHLASTCKQILTTQTVSESTNTMTRQYKTPLFSFIALLFLFAHSGIFKTLHRDFKSDTGLGSAAV